jgi:hypothetical protein
LRTCAVSAAFGRELGLPPPTTSTTTSPSRAWLKELDFGDETMLSRQLARFGAWAPGRQAAMTTLFLDTAAVTGTNASRSSCEVGRAVGG